MNKKQENRYKTLTFPDSFLQTDFCFTDYAFMTKKFDIQFFYWFIGFCEGDGSFTKCKDGRVIFYINQKETRVLNYICIKLGFGKVYKYQKFSRYYVGDRDNLNKLINLFNGQFVLNKTDQKFFEWLQMYNTKYKTSIVHKTKRGKASLDNSWLSGFTDAEGCFAASISIRKLQNTYRLRTKFFLDQKDEKPVLYSILQLLNAGFIVERKKRINKIKSEIACYRLCLDSLKSQIELTSYFKKQPLKSKKKWSLKRWLRIRAYITNKKPISPEDWKKLQALCRGINRFNY